MGGKAFYLLPPLMSAVGTIKKTNRHLHVTKWEIPTCVLLISACRLYSLPDYGFTKAFTVTAYHIYGFNLKPYT